MFILDYNNNINKIISFFLIKSKINNKIVYILNYNSSIKKTILFIL